MKIKEYTQPGTTLLSKYAVFIIFRLGQARPWATTDSSGVLSDHELFPVPLPCSPTHSFSRLSRAIFTPYLSPPSQSKVLFLPLPIPKLLHSTWSHVWPTPTHNDQQVFTNDFTFLSLFLFLLFLFSLPFFLIFQVICYLSFSPYKYVVREIDVGVGQT